MLHRITLTAQRLTNDRGLDGFTMDDLAEAADVSRRTLFNYFPSKVDAVLGPPPTLDGGLARPLPCAGRPHGDLVEDLGELATHVLEAQELTREEMARGRRLLLENPRLLAAAHERLDGLSAQLVEAIRGRAGGTSTATAPGCWSACSPRSSTLRWTAS